MKKAIKLTRGIFTLLIMALIALCISTPATAADNDDTYSITNLRQIGSSEDSFAIRWDSKGFKYFDVFFSTSIDGPYIKLTDNSTRLNMWPVYNRDLKPGTSYYIKVQGSTYDRSTVMTTEPFEVVTDPVMVGSIKQTSGTTKKVSISWTPVTGATGYTVYRYNKDKTKLLDTKAVSGTNITLSTSAGKAYAIEAVPFRESKSKFRAMNTDKSDYPLVYAYSAPGKATNVAKTVSYNSLQYQFGWTEYKNEYKGGITWKVEIYSLKGKKLATISERYRACDVKSKKLQNQLAKYGFKVRVRASCLHNNLLLNGEWTDFKTVVPAAKLTTSSYYKIKKSTFKITWKPVKNASCYYLCVNRNNGKGKWTSTRIKKNQTSYVIRNIKKGQKVQAYVVPVVKVNGKNVRGTKNNYSVTTLTR